ncbi:SMI1/KNR4 family protein [Nocardia huaxiensis]|uniref:SMI1/KNR4 family protein n=1 Tax=Nocardia huaxiensis TaxID=2755382 RepID=A0A7D6VHI1_9NOCA|nr:SMI1/KNR4 family protein [Nocardia huaxiensis]QLY32957.1 SMI1/KNR4 family protein [Nocardia huaxiensis]
MVSFEHVEAMKVLCRELLASGIATVDEIEGCSASEIGEVVSAAAQFPLPDEYLAFLRVLGKKAGALFRGTDLFFPTLLEAKEAALDIAEGPDESLKLEDRFFFGHHQGYKVYFFELGSPAVFAYQEGHPEVELLADSFLKFLQHALEVRKSLI